MSNGPKGKLPTYEGRRDGGLARVRDLKSLVAWMKSMPSRPGKNVQFREGPNGTVIDAKSSTGGSGITRKWNLTRTPGTEPIEYTLNPGRIYDGDTLITISPSTLSEVPADGDAFYLEVTGIPTGTWTATLEYGTLPDVYAVTAGVMTYYRLPLVEFTTAAQSDGLELDNGVWARWFVGDTDLLAISTVIQDPGGTDAVLAMELVGY